MPCVLVCWAAVKMTTEGQFNRNFFSHSSRGYKSTIKVLAFAGVTGTSFRDLKMAAFSCILTWLSLRACPLLVSLQVQISSSYKDTSDIKSGLQHNSSFESLFKDLTFKYGYILRYQDLEIRHMNFEGQPLSS